MRALGQESRDLDVGVHAVLQFSVKLEEEFVGKKHRGVALLAAENIGRQNSRDRTYAWTERADQISISSAGVLSIQHESEKFLSKIGVPDRVEENRIVIVTETCDDRVRRRLGKRPRFVVGKDLYRQSIGFGRAIEITYFDEPELGGVGLRRNRGTFKHAHLPKRSGFGAEPATSGDVFG
ncbi:MAG: hypothetical protein DME41_03895 [Verrucomicrobia bacterium]|nr:MAG: hypothetical protein DME41_03895 [Verrucomicrobiota bacterium]